MNILKLLLFVIFSFFTIISCAQDSTYIKEIQQLTNDSLKKQYLENIFRLDQEIRVYWQESSLTDTSYLARKKVLSEVREVDSINLIKVVLYLQLYGYPTRDKIDGLALMVPWLIIHHATHNEPRIKLYPILLKAFREGHLNEEQFRGYLCRTLSEHTEKEHSHFYEMKLTKLITKMNKIYKRETILTSSIQ